MKHAWLVLVTWLVMVPASHALSPWGEQKILVIPINFQDKLTQPWTPQQIANRGFAPPGASTKSVNAYYRETSFNKTWVTGEVTAWVTMPASQSYNSCNYSTWGQLADQAAIAQGYDLSAYHRRHYIMVKTACGFGGVAYVNGEQAWMNGTINLHVWAHELGHNLGFRHAATIKCGTKAIDTPEHCAVQEYGDKYDVMSSTGEKHLNGVHKWEKGFVHPNAVKTTSVSGTWTLTPLETYTETATQVLRIPIPSLPLTYYFLSYRQKLGFDAGLPDGIVQGVSVHRGKAGERTLQLDTSPGDDLKFKNAALADGMSFYDPLAQIRVTQVAHDATGATVSVEVGE